MNCDEANVMMHALIDGELDAGHAREVESACRRLRRLRGASCANSRSCARSMTPASLALCRAGGFARAHRRQAAGAARGDEPARRASRASRLAPALSAIAASGLLVMVMRGRRPEARSGRGRVGASALAAGAASDRRGCRATSTRSSPGSTAGSTSRRRWSISPRKVSRSRRPARLRSTPSRWRRSSIAAASTSSICSARRRRAPASARASMESLHGFNVRRWSENGLNLWAVSDLNAEELTEFGEKFEAALRQ